MQVPSGPLARRAIEAAGIIDRLREEIETTRLRADLVVLLASDANKAVETLRSEKDLDDVPAKFLAGAARHLRVVSYAAAVTARRFERLAEQREHAEAVRRAHLIAEDIVT